MFNASKTRIYHPPVITIFIGGINQSQSWLVYGIVFLCVCLQQ